MVITDSCVSSVKNLLLCSHHSQRRKRKNPIQLIWLVHIFYYKRLHTRTGPQLCACFDWCFHIRCWRSGRNKRPYNRSKAKSMLCREKTQYKSAILCMYVQTYRKWFSGFCVRLVQFILFRIESKYITKQICWCARQIKQLYTRRG